MGALRTSMATCGYETLKELQKADLVVVPQARAELASSVRDLARSE
jgi:IMP dehydrogenase